MLAAAYGHRGAAGRAWVAALPALAGGYLDRWRLRPDGPPRWGTTALVLPVRSTGGAVAVLKLQPVDEETAGEAVALRAWGGQGAVRLLDHDPATGTMLLERLDAGRPLSTVPDDRQRVRVIGGLLARLTAVTAPPGVRRIQDVAERMLGDLPRTLAGLAAPEDRRLVRACAAAVTGLLPVRGGRLLHWDLHVGNVLAGDREPWLAIDPKPLAGEPGFELLPALRARLGAVAPTEVARAVLGRFDLLVEVLGLDPARAAGWSLARVLQDIGWDVEEGAGAVAPVHATIARALIPRAG
jgi:streptomycin 6-kinase